MDLTRRELEEILNEVMKSGGDFADIFIEEKLNTGIGCEDNQIERVVSGEDQGAGIRVIAGDSTAYAYTNDLSLESLLKVAQITSKAVQEKKGDIKAIDLRNKGSLHNSWPIEEQPDEVAIEEKVNLVEKANEAARRVDKRIRQVSVGYGDVLQQITIANTEGDFVEDRRIRTRFVINTVAAEQDTIQTALEVKAGTKGFELCRHGETEDLAESAAKRALMMLRAKPAPAGKMPVVMAGRAGGTMVHEACGHGLEADLHQKNLSVYSYKLGEKVADETVTVVDDATIPGKYGSLLYDDEGVPGQKTVLIEKGVLKSYMYDRLTACREKCKSTGNGRRESFHHKPIPRMTNTYIKAGKDDPEKIIRETEYGLLVKKMGGGQVNTTNGDFVFDVAEGYLIKDGEVKAPVRGATLTGNGPEVLQSVDMVGRDLGFTVGTCGKDGQGVPVSDAQPTIRIPELVIGGLLPEEGEED